eukprot:gene6234-21497_t
MVQQTPHVPRGTLAPLWATQPDFDAGPELAPHELQSFDKCGLLKSRWASAHVAWTAKKNALGQDIFLVGATDGAAGASGLISAGDVIQEIDGGDVRNFSGAEIKDRLRQIGKVVTVNITFVIKTKETLVEQSGGVTGEYAAATHPDARGGGDVGGQQEEQESEYAKAASGQAAVEKYSRGCSSDQQQQRTEDHRHLSATLSAPKHLSGANPFDNLVAADEAAEADNVSAMLADCDEYHGAMPRDESAALIT